MAIRTGMNRRDRRLIYTRPNRAADIGALTENAARGAAGLI
jgi:hypothetical protein